MTIFFLVLHSSFSFSQARIDSLELQLKNAGNDTSRINVLNDLCWELRRMDAVKAGKYLVQSRQLLDKNPFPRGEMSYFRSAGVLYMEQGKYDSALDFFSKSLSLSEKLNDLRSKGTVLGNMGLVYRKQSLFDKALDYQLQSLAIKEQMKDKKGMALTYGNIGTIYWEQASRDTSYYGKALEYYLKNLKLAEEIGDQKGIASACNNVAIIYGHRRMDRQALEFYKRSLKIKEVLKDRKGIAQSDNNIGLVYYNLKEFGKALEYYLAALKLFEDLRDKSGVATTCVNIGNAYKMQKDMARAELYLRRAITLAAEIGIRDILLEAYKNITMLYSEQKDFKNAFTYSQLYQHLKDTIFNENSTARFTDMQAKFETEKKEQQIALQKTQIALQDSEIGKKDILIWAAAGALLLVAGFMLLVYNRWKITQRQKKIIEDQKKLVDEKNKIVEEKNKDITDSIDYAKKIQQAILPEENEFEKFFRDSFVLFQPKDIVSGDFYWIAEKGEYVFFTAADCTGHGVPGGFMSMLGNSLLNEVISEKNVTEPADVLDLLRVKIIQALKQKGETSESKDGMDMCLCRLNRKNNELVYAAANNPLWLVRNNQLKEFSADKQPVGISVGAAAQFNQQRIELRENDLLYIFTDGYADQFGGEKGKKLKYSQLKEKLLSVSALPMQEQKNRMNDHFERWKGGLEQVDDVLVIGVRI